MQSGDNRIFIYFFGWLACGFMMLITDSNIVALLLAMASALNVFFYLIADKEKKDDWIDKSEYY